MKLKNYLDHLLSFVVVPVLTSCADPVSFDPHADIEGYVGTGKGGSQVKVIHSPSQRKAKKVRNIPIGSPLTECLPNMPAEIVIDSVKTLQHYTHLGDGFDSTREFYMNQAVPLTASMNVNRWGERQFESALIENSLASVPVFDIFSINHGASFEGRGLYTDLSVIGSFGYSVFTYVDHVNRRDWNLEIPMLVSLKIPRGTYYINHDQRNNLKNNSALDPRYQHFIQEDQQKPHTPAPVVIHYNAISDYIPLKRNPNPAVPSDLIRTKVGSHWHVIKSAEGVEAKEFDGQEYSTKELIEYERVMRTAVTQRQVPHADKVYSYYMSRVEPLFSKRTFKPHIPEEIPYPLTAIYPAKVWGHFEEMNHCIGAKIPNGRQEILYYYWRFDGSCGGYADEKGKYLVLDPPTKRGERGFNALTHPSNRPCLAVNPSESVWIRDEALDGLRCMDVIPIRKKELSTESKRDKINYIIIGKHEKDADCGAQ